MSFSVERAEHVVCGKPYVACSVEGDAFYFLRRQSVAAAESLELESVIGVGVYASAKSSSVCANPHCAFCVAFQLNDILAVQVCLHFLAVFHASHLNVVSSFLHYQHSVGGACPYSSPFVHGKGSYFPVLVFRVVTHYVVAVGNYLRSVLVLCQHVHSSAVGCYPDVTVRIFHSGVDVLVVKPYLPAFLHSVSCIAVTASSRCHLYYSRTFGAYPIVAFSVLAYAVDSSEVACTSHVVVVVHVHSVGYF